LDEPSPWRFARMVPRFAFWNLMNKMRQQLANKLLPRAEMRVPRLLYPCIDVGHFYAIKAAILM